jgi:hypothetical protein
MLWENYKPEGNTAIEQGQYRKAENLLRGAIEQADLVGSLNPRLADSLNELTILYAKQPSIRRRSLCSNAHWE